MRSRGIAVLVVAVALIAAVLRHPSADIRILTHDSADPTPHRIQAAVDLGVVGVNLLITWTGKHIG